MAKLPVLLGLAWFAVVSSTYSGDAPKLSGSAQDVPWDHSVVLPSEVHDLHPFVQAALVWPGRAVIEAERADCDSLRVRAACDWTFEWLTRALKPEYCPQRSEVEFFPLGAHLQGHDVVRLRYRKGDHVVQVMATSARLSLVIEDTSRDSSIDLLGAPAAETYIRRCFSQFISEEHRVTTVSMQRIVKTAGGMQGVARFETDSVGWLTWPVPWWTDGKTTFFSVREDDRTRKSPTRLVKDWFSGAE